ncbi:MAG: DUF4399 domain-containing protein [Chloroflexota bacterium]
MKTDHVTSKQTLNHFLSSHRHLVIVSFILIVTLLLGACGNYNAEKRVRVTPTPTPTATPVVTSLFQSPQTGDVVDTTFTVKMSVEGEVEIEPSGEVKPESGHAHILINTDFIAPGGTIPNDTLHRHYGDGSLETELTLPPGEHTLRLQIADGAHTALDGDGYRDEIVITVEGEQQAFFAEPADGATVSSPFTVVMAVEGLFIEPSGEVMEGAGHMHILVDTDFVEPGEIIPADDQHLHYGDGSVETELDLEPGEYTLRLQFADGLHTALEGDQYRDEITITVE